MGEAPTQAPHPEEAPLGAVSKDALRRAPPSPLWGGIEGGGRERSEPAKNKSANQRDWREAPPSVLSDISPARGEIGCVTAFANHQT